MVKKKKAAPVKKPPAAAAKAKPRPSIAPPPPQPLPDAASALAAETVARLLQDERVPKLAEVLGVSPQSFADAIVHSALYPDADPKRLSPAKPNGKVPFNAAQLVVILQKAVAELRTTEPFLAARKQQLRFTQAKRGDSRVADPKLEAELVKKLRFGARGP